MRSHRPYTLGEEIAHGVTHGVGAALAVAGLTLLVTMAALVGDARKVTAFAVYGATLVLLYLASTLYHAIPHPRAKLVLQKVDHCAIYLLIAGTYTPFTLVSLRGAWGWTLFGLIWALALLGIVREVFLSGRGRFVSTGIYIAMGWIVVVALRPLAQAVTAGGMAWIVAGGVCYTGGAVFYLLKKVPYTHAVWHLFVLGGSICHFFAMLLYVL